MSQSYLFQDVRKCIGCRSCEVQCKTNKNLPLGPKPCQIVQVGPKMVGGLPRSAFVFMPCYHCEKPWCVAACPTGAMQKRAEDGIVFVDSETCVGCKACIRACPWGAPQWDALTRKVVKCDYCKDRLDQGLEPACVTVCPTHCLTFGRVEDTTGILRRRHAQNVASLENSAM
ncbi:MAG: 4Fe-4S binding protein [Desulfobacteraceae bacterium]|jgi:Fe-S-cluster-containing dehydrogenase component